MDDKIFRKKSIERISSPEELNAYIKSTSPKLWIVLFGVIVLLAGTILWATIGKIDSGRNIGCTVTSGRYECVINEETYKKIENEVFVKIDSKESKKAALVEGPKQNNGNLDSYLLHLSDIDSNGWFYSISGEIDGIEDGNYEAFLVLERLSPIVFIIN